MQMTTKLPQGLTGISRFMGMQTEEVKEWPHYKEVASLFKDYNMGVLSKERLLEKLSSVLNKCKEDELDYFCEGLENVTEAIKICY